MNIAGKIVKGAKIISQKSLREALLRCRVAAGVEHFDVLRALPACTVVVDVGANRGQFALAARQCWPLARIISFEPLPEPVAVFRRVFSDDGAVFMNEVAIGPARRRDSMHVSGRDDSSSLLPISDRQEALFSGTRQVGSAMIDIAPLDDFLSKSEIKRTALLKIDVQGYELRALEGCASLIECFDWAYIECSFVELYEKQALADEVISWLHERGLRLRGVYNMSYDAHGVAVQADFLFGRQ